MHQHLHKAKTRVLEVAKNCNKVDTQLAAMTIEGKAEISASVNCTEGTKRGHGKNQSQGTNNTKHEKTWALSILVKISGISGSAVNGTRFVGSSHWKIPRKSGKTKKVVPFSRLEFPNGMSCSIYVSRSLYQFQVHGRAPPRTGVYDQMEQLFTNRKFHFSYHRNFRVFFS